MPTKIEWASEVWNPVTGCSPVSTGCANCYGRRLAGRFRHHYPQGFGKVTLHPERLEKPMHWRKPRRVFVVSMGDLFHDAVPDDFIAAVFGIMLVASRHQFIVLTKRPDRMRSLLNELNVAECFLRASLKLSEAGFDTIQAMPDLAMVPYQWPAPNICLGVSVENQEWADRRIPVLLETPAAVRVVSCEPILSAVDLSRWLLSREGADYEEGWETEEPWIDPATLDWVICGSESGPNARPMDLDWARSLRDQCQGVPFFFKQYVCNGRRISMPLLDGVRWEQYP